MSDDGFGQDQMLGDGMRERMGGEMRGFGGYLGVSVDI